MGHTTLCLITFEKTLIDIHSNLLAFIATLDNEKKFLQKSKIDELESSLVHKKMLAESLEKVSMECQRLLNNANFPFNDKSIMKIISDFPTSKQGDLITLWQEIKALIKLCDKKNIVNGVMITTLKNYNDSMLRILTKRPKESVYSNQPNKNPAPVSTREHKA